MGKNITLSQGHGGADAGSKGADGIWERDRIRDLVPDIKKKLADYGHDITIKSEKNSSGKWAFSAVSGDLKVSFHFNAYNGRATGTEVLYKKSSMKNYAASMSKKVAKAMGVPNRGAKYRSDLYVLNIGFDLLVEVCFHDNKSDLAAYKKNKEKVASAIVEAIVDMVGSKKGNGTVIPKCPTVTLQRGDTGPQVKSLQRFLNEEMDAGLTVDGSYGSATFAAVKAFQRKYDLEVDGSCGPKTRAKIKALM